LENLSRAPATLFAKRQQAADEYRRLTSVYQQFVDWSNIICSTLHRPWGNTEPVEVPAWTTNTGVLSFSVGEAVVSQTELAAAALAVAQRVSTTGWLNGAFDERRRLWLEWYRQTTGGVAGLSATPEADASLSDSTVVHIPAALEMDELEVRRPRYQFMRSMVDGHFADEYRAAQFRSLRNDVERLDPARLIERVNADVPALDGRDAQQFLKPPVENAAIPLFDHESCVVPRYRVQGGLTIDTWVGCSPALSVSVPANRTIFPVIELPDRFVLASFRLDVSAAIPAADCPLVAVQASANDNAEETAQHSGRG
jgi:hypothetical protein